MTLGSIVSRLNRVQHGYKFRIIASIIIVAAITGAWAALWIAANEPGAPQRIALRAAERARREHEFRGTGWLDRGPIQAFRHSVDSFMIAMRPLEARRIVQPETPGQPPAKAQSRQTNTGAVQVAVIFGAVAVGLLAVVWLGMGLTFLGVLLVGGGIAWPLMLWPPTAGLGALLMGASPLLLAFVAGIKALGVLLSGSGPVFAVARNVLSEAIRMKISLVFIVMLLLLLAYVPGALNEDQPLRYRVQQWMQYGIGLSYAVLALLTVFLSVATVAFEQRDRVIWQTMTKPVAPWQYLLGKWIGVMALNAVLLSVTAAGVFLFTEYLRHQPAQGEMAYHVRDDGTPTINNPAEMTEDRRLLETQVLVARVGVPFQPFALSDARLARIVEEQVRDRMAQDQSVQDTSLFRAEIEREVVADWRRRLDEAIESRVHDLRVQDENLVETAALRNQLTGDILGEWEALYRTVAQGQAKLYFFTGVSSRPDGQPLTLRYKVNAGSNDPSDIYRVTFVINGVPFDRQVALKAAQTLVFPPQIVPENGRVDIVVANDPSNPREISLPPDGLEVLYVAGGYEVNFLRIILAMWVKLSFIAAVSIATATFLSFSVACLVSLSVLFAAESAGYLHEALEYYTSMTKEGIDWVAVVVRVIAVPIAAIFKVYASLRPTANLVDGRLVGWGELAGSAAIIGAWAVAVLGLGLAIFRRRELATYSGR